MLFTIVIAILFAAVVFFHYLQGLFSSLLSAIIAVVAAVLAFSWHEIVVEKLCGGNAANIAHSLVLVGLFAVIYLGLRTLFDKAVPHGVMLPAIVDRAGGAILGIVAATFSVGIFVIACEELPFGSNVGGYTKYDSTDTNAQVPSTSNGQMQTGFNYDELHSNDAGHFAEADRKNLFPVIFSGVDEIVIATVAHLSDGGSLSGDQPLNRVHPDFLQEMYGQNIGVQSGAKHVVVNLPSKPPVISIAGVYFTTEVNIVDGEPSVLRGPQGVALPLQKSQEFKVAVKGEKEPHRGQYGKLGNSAMMLAVVRITFSNDAADGDALIRLSPGSIRLVTKKSGQSGELRNNYPIGMLEPGRDVPNLFADKLDDYLIIPVATGDAHAAVDAVFAIDKDGFATTEKGHSTIDNGVFIEVKRMCREDLSGRSIDPYVPAGANIKIGTMHQQKAVERFGP